MADTIPTALVTGGAGFIGSNLVRHLLAATDWRVVTLDALTYAGHLRSLDDVADDPRTDFERVDIRDAQALADAFARHRPRYVFHLAAETHVDRSIDEPGIFVETNVLGTLNVLKCTLDLFEKISAQDARLIHVSTDEVYGSAAKGAAFTEATPYDPRSPYSASKAGADHLVRAWFQTYGLPVCLTNCSNNYGPRQHPEKLVPFMTLSGLAGRAMPVYGDGRHVRDWLFADDHCAALTRVAEAGAPGETYLVGGRAARDNIDVVRKICAALDARNPSAAPHDRLIRFVKDRPGHDRRYAIDPTKIERALGWRAAVDFETGLARTIDWYRANRDWWAPLLGDGDGDGAGLGGLRHGRRGADE